MRALSSKKLAAALAALCSAAFTPIFSDALENPDFETGRLDGWTAAPYQLAIDVTTNETFNRNFAARIHGSYSGDDWITNSLSQTFNIAAGDVANVVGFFHWASYEEAVTQADAYVEAVLEGPGDPVVQRWTSPTNTWLFFDLYQGVFGVSDGHFESGALKGWTIGADDLAIALNRTTVYDGNYSLAITGSWSGGWSFNQAFQGFMLKKGDVVSARAMIHVRDFQIGASSPSNWAVAGIKLEMEGTATAVESVIPANAANTGWTNLEFTMAITNDGYYVFRCMVCGDSGFRTNHAEVYFDDVRFTQFPVGVNDGGFEAGTNTFYYWWVSTQAVAAAASTNFRSSGAYSLNMAGTWTGWNWNEIYQVVSLRSGDVVEASGRIYLDDLEASKGWVAAGIKLESADGISDFESVYDRSSAEDTWLDMSFTAAITNPGLYVFRNMVCGDVQNGLALADVYFDDVRLWRRGDATADVVSVTLKLSYAGHSGGAGNVSSADVYFDSMTLSGSSAGPEPAPAQCARLRAAAAAVAADPSETDIAPVLYPKLNAYGYPGGVTSSPIYGSHAEVCVNGWRFRHFTNDVAITLTNTVLAYGLGGAGAGWFEIDQYQYVGKFWQTSRGDPVQVDTNAPYFVLGAKDNSSAEFGEGPFEADHTYVVGTSLTNFPRRMVTAYDGRWPTTLRIVFDEDLGRFNRSWDKYFVLSTIPSNGPASNVKAVKVFLACDEPGNTNLAFQTHELHMGWSDDTLCRGMVDYPNCTYQDHNEVALRSAYRYGLLDQDGWFIQQVPRGSATIEPIELYALGSGSWIQKMYEEYLFTWPSAASGVRSIFDSDLTDRIPGPACYNVGYKIGHQYGTNEYGEPQFPGVIELRGNGYFRMTDYDGVMGGSFRPVSMDVFGLFQNKEDAPVMPAAYARLVPRTTPTNHPQSGAQRDDSYCQMLMPVQSKTNYWLTGAVTVDGHFAPDEAEDEGAYFELESDIYANRALNPAEHGKLNAFAQVDMYWRGGNAVDDGTEGHDFDAVMVKKADGEWITHLPINPPTNIYHRSLGAFRSNDTVYLMQQDRGPESYGFSTEAPYRKVSTFEIAMLDDGGRDLSLDVFEQNTVSEINDNVVVVCALNEPLEKGEGVHCRYRYRSVYAPGVTILSPGAPAGGENWSNRVYTIDFVATDGEDLPLQANLYYGNGRDDGWTLINQGELLMVPGDTHRVTYDWNVAGVPPGAYYIKAEARRVDGGKTGFDVSDTRLQVGDTVGFGNNGSPHVLVVTNAVGFLGTNPGFEAGDVMGWAAAGDDLDIYATYSRSYEGVYSARMRGTGWSGWSWNNLQQEIPCRSGEVLHVTGRIYIGKLGRGGTNWVACGIKMESTNGVGIPDGDEFKETITTGVWLNVDFHRTAPVDGTDRLLLWVAGYDGSGADVYFDDLKVMSTNTGLVVTNRIRSGYWEGDLPVDVSAHDALSFRVSSPRGGSNVFAWVADADGVTNSVPLTNVLERVIPFEQPAEIAWTNFPGIDRARVQSFGFSAPGSNWAVKVSGVRSLSNPFRVTARPVAPPMADLEGLPHYNPGQDSIQVITVENRSVAARSGLRIQVLQEYAEDTFWTDKSHSPWKQSEKTRRGDRLCGGFERVWEGVSIPAGGSVTLTNVYSLPEGRLIDHTQHALPSEADWYIFRNYAAHGQVHVVVREADGDNLYDADQAGLYSMDDDFDLDDDELTDYWEQLYGEDCVSLDPADDLDDDGYDNLAEFRGGSNPLDGSSYPGHVTSYTLHLAYTNGTDLFPRAVAEETNYTAAACAWMITRYLNGASFTQTQSQIYHAAPHSPEHHGEITPQGCAGWMYSNVVAGYYFSARYRTNLNEALKESVYWMDYLPPGGKKTPVYIVCGTGWSYKVVRGFQSDRAPYDGGYGLTTNGTFTVYGAWLNDPKLSGLGYNIYATAAELDTVYQPSEANGRYWFVCEPPQDPAARSEALDAIDSTTMELAAPKPDAAMATYLGSMFGGSRTVLPAGSKKAVKSLSYTPKTVPADLRTVLPDALRTDEVFMDLFDHVTATNYYLVNANDPTSAYILAAGGLLGPASTVCVLKLGTNGAMQQATWDANPSLYLPAGPDAAEWVARRAGIGLAGSTNLLLNGGFETNTGSSGSADRWISGGAAVTESWGYRSGGWSMAVCNWRGEDAAYLYQDVTNASEGAGYTFAIWLSRDPAFTSGTVVLKLEWFGAGMYPLGSVANDVRTSLTNEYGLRTVTGTAPAGTRTVRCTVYVGDIEAGGAALKCDDTMLFKTSAGAALADASLAYDPASDPSPFLPHWELLFVSASGITTQEVAQGVDLGGDADGDGMPDGNELYAGSDPLSAGSVFTAEVGAAGAGADVTIYWPSLAGRRYSVLRATNLVHGSFSTIAIHLPAAPPENSYVDQLSAPSAFYRVEVE